MKNFIRKLCSEQARPKLAIIIGIMGSFGSFGLLFEYGMRVFGDVAYIDPFHDRITAALCIMTVGLLAANEFVLQKRASCPPMICHLLHIATAAGIVVSAFTAAASVPILRNVWRRPEKITGNRRPFT